jgi:hypothetical protein
VGKSGLRNIASGYEPRWDIDVADGHQGELFVQWALTAIVTGASVEIKTDRESWRTGNIYIEQQCKVSRQWVASGIERTNADLWAHLVVGPQVLFAPAAYVRYVARKYGKDAECRTGRHPTRGKVLRLGHFVELLAHLNRAWIDGEPVGPPVPELDVEAPFGRTPEGRALAPWGLNKDGRVRLVPGGRRVAHGEPEGLWPEEVSDNP